MKTYTVRQVNGRDFKLQNVPVDMLRYDSAKIVSHEPGQAVLQSEYPPTKLRWKSFGWMVI